MPSRRNMRSAFFVLMAFGVLAASAFGQTKLPPHAEVLKGYDKVPVPNGQRGMYTLYHKKNTGELYAELPSSFTSKKYMFALTLAGGARYAGLQSGEQYVYWRKYGNRLALIKPQIAIRANKAESKSSVKRLFTDQILLDTRIVTMGPGGGPVIDLDQVLLTNLRKFFGPDAFYFDLSFTPHPTYTRTGLVSVKKKKTFKQNVEVAFELPDISGNLKTVHFSISEIPDSTGYKPRKADPRIGYFTTEYTDLSAYDAKQKDVRYITRWDLRKANPKLKLSPPKKPIIFYIEHTTPVRYRRWVADGVLSWNKAFEKIGIFNAIEVRYQDASLKDPRIDNMDKDPEDVQYNFVRWLNNDIGTAIGPSRVHPLTGQILDADIILTDGWIRSFEKEFTELLPQIAMEGFSAETYNWLAQHPNWDPRVRLAEPAKRMQVARQIAKDFAVSRERSLTSDKALTKPFGGLCNAADGMAFEVGLMRMHLEMMLQEEEDKKKDEKKDGDKKEKDDEKKPEEKEEKEQELDGMPESFIGPLLSHLVAHEVGHTLGLRHNFKGSSIHPLSKINGKEKLEGAMSGSVMDYVGTNITAKKDGAKGDWIMKGIGPYDEWAIEYGYTTGDLKKILARVAEPELVYASDEDTSGPDPLARRYDFAADPLDFANSQVKLAKSHRAKLLKDFVKDGESWAKARKGYEMTLSLQSRAVSMMANWIGGAFVNRDFKGDPNGRDPVVVVPVEQQRKALAFVIEQSFNDDSFGLTSDLLNRLTVDHWNGGDATWPVHDRIMGIQSSALTMLMNPTTLKRVYDNEYRIAADDDALTLPELLTSVSDAIWAELDKADGGKGTARKPAISSLRRNLQREHMERLIDLTLPGAGSSAAYKPIQTLARAELQKIHKKIEKAGEKDPYTTAHLASAGEQIKKALDADYVFNQSDSSGGGLGGFFFLREEQKENADK
ncbi:MAG: zinc-dependent metalloprotease [Planctomycetaceae bacterium]